MAHVSVGKGDVLVQAPGTIHAVVTPEDALVAGFFFYIAATFSRTIKCLTLSVREPLHENDDPKCPDWHNLITVVQNLCIQGLFTPEHVHNV
ncbi:hypothetical protein LTR56_027280 [Elasticomyces elasticus]|nr:hypothetical protein LTR56_027280 [Elasticomyces elasticus]KAK4902402.1 hypothetical protein LTR49_027076 [Elasticomyces elasticus]KAK5735488.1 hypothetical protein LTS12_026457 [Elasticomyces elasticus]